MKKRWFFLILWIGIVLAAYAAAGEETDRVPTPEAPAPVRTARPQTEGRAFPDIINRTSDPDAWPRFSFRQNAKLLHIWFPDINNADEAILIYDGETWLIDCGDRRMGSRGAELIRKLGIRKIDRLINSHPHHDHINGLEETDRAAKIEALYICYETASTRSMISAMEYVDSVGMTVREYRDGSEAAMGDGAVTMKFYLNQDPELDMNNQGAMAMVRYGKRSILFTADVDQPGQTSLMARVPAAELKADLLKYPHHGKHFLDETFYEAVKPAAAIITNSRNADWYGPKFLAKKDVPYVLTSNTEYYAHLMTDGEYWVMEWVKQSETAEKWQVSNDREYLVIGDDD